MGHISLNTQTNLRKFGLGHEILRIADSFNVDTSFSSIDDKTVSRDLWGKREDKTVFVENINYHTGNCDLAMELVFNDPGSEFDGIEYVRFINVLTPQKVKLVLKNCPLYSDERELLESIMSHLNLPTDKESVDKEIENYVGLYELI